MQLIDLMTTAEYNTCVEKYADSLYRFILKNTNEEHTAMDIIQETFTKLWEKVDNVSVNKAKSYLFTTAYHTFIDHIRKEKNKATYEQQFSINELCNEQYSDLQEQLNLALRQIPEIQRSVILLRDYEGYSYQEIGEITGLSESQVKVYIYRGRMALKNYIGSIEALL